MLHTLVFLFMTNLVGAFANEADRCERAFGASEVNYLGRLSEIGFLPGDDRDFARARPVTVRLLSDARSWNLRTNEIRTESGLNGGARLPGVLVTTASGDQMVILFPRQVGREIQRLPGLRAEIYDERDELIARHDDADGWVSPAPARRTARASQDRGVATPAGGPVVTWRYADSGGVERVVTSTPPGPRTTADDRTEAPDGVRAPPHASLIRRAVAGMEFSRTREFLREYWRPAQRALGRYPFDEMAQATVIGATIDGAAGYEALVGPEVLGRSWVLLVDSRNRREVRSDGRGALLIETDKVLTAVPFGTARLEDGRALIPEFMSWSVGTGGAGGAAARLPRPERPAPAGDAGRSYLEAAE